MLLVIGFLFQKGIGEDRLITSRNCVEINSTLYKVKSGKHLYSSLPFPSITSKQLSWNFRSCLHAWPDTLMNRMTFCAWLMTWKGPKDNHALSICLWQHAFCLHNSQIKYVSSVYLIQKVNSMSNKAKRALDPVDYKSVASSHLRIFCMLHSIFCLCCTLWWNCSLTTYNCKYISLHKL